MSVALPVIVGLATLLNGCGDNKSPAKTDGVKTKTVPVVEKKTTPKQPEGKKRKPAVKLKPYDPPKTVELKDVTPKELQDFIATQKGRVVMVDYWFVDCGPCRIALPHTVDLAGKHAKDGLVVVTMCVDTLGNRERGLSFLKKSNARLVNFYASEKLDPDTLADVFEAPSFPYYRLYGPDGKPLPSLKSTSLDPADLRKKVDAAVKQALGL
jgi:thiol-disulfide isomerase/thioredoxin